MKISIDDLEQNLKYYQYTKENQYLERKSAKKNPREILKHLIAFANADGGKLVVGIEDTGEITGFNNPNSHSIEDYKNIALIELRDTPINAQYLEVDVKNNNNVVDSILIIEISPAIDRIIKSPKGEVFLRRADESINLNSSQIIQLEYDRGQRFFEDEIIINSSIEDIDEETMNIYKKFMEMEHRSTEEILNARNMIQDGQLTNSAILLFGKNPTKYLPQARVKFIRYDGNAAKVGTEINIIKEKTFDSCIPKLIPEIKEFVNSQLREFQYLDENGVFQKMPEYPEFAWFEGIVNSLTHRNYSIRGDYIKVIMFDDRLEILSPGLLPNIVNLNNLLHQRYSRNPRIARVLSEFGWVKEMNEGVKRIYSEMERFFLNSPSYSEPDNNVLLVLENNILHRHLRIEDSIAKRINSDVFQSLSDEEKLIVHYCFINGKISIKVAHEYIDRSKPYTRDLIRNLVDKKILVWRGSNIKDPMQYYEINTSS